MAESAGIGLGSTWAWAERTDLDPSDGCSSPAIPARISREGTKSALLIHSGVTPNRCALSRSTQQPRRTPEMVSSSQGSVEVSC
jgi:hypothetical protein